ncbi:hypothetical protein HOY80DRAFT_956915 [Tuber brumale]|nr:hypothetical protein HOY80DRAFT_956915 [Tuber brumale]
MERRKCQPLKETVLTVLYSTLMLLIASLQSREVHRLSRKVERGAQCDHAAAEWEGMREDDILGKR